MHQEQVLARALTDESAHVERDTFRVAVDDGFHLDELGVHVVRAGLRHCRQRIGSQPRPRRDTHVAAIGLAAQIFSPRIIDDVDLGRRVERVHACLAISAQHNWAYVAGPRAVVPDHIEHALNQLLAGEVDVDAVDLGRVEQPLHVFVGSENGWAAGQFVAANAFEDRRAVMDDVRHHMNGGVVPVDELAIVPDLLGLLNRHAHSLKVAALLNNYIRGMQGIGRVGEGRIRPSRRPGAPGGGGTALTWECSRSKHNYDLDVMFLQEHILYNNVRTTNYVH